MALTEDEILEVGFTKLDYSTDDIQYYIIDVSRVERYGLYDAHNEYILKVDTSETDIHDLGSTLKLGQFYGIGTNSRKTTFTTKEELEEELARQITWDLKH